MAALGLRSWRGLSLVVASGGYSLAAVRRLLVEVALGAEHGFSSTSSVVVMHGLSCSLACEIFLEQEANPCLLH